MDFCCLYYQCLSCLIVKCLFLTFIFNYFVSLRRFRAMLPRQLLFLFLFFMFHESRISHSFSVYQVDIYAAHTSLPVQQTQIQAHKSRTKGMKQQENLVLHVEARGKHWVERERISGESRSTLLHFFLYRKYGRKSWTCVGSNIVVVFINRRENINFQMKISFQKIGERKV